MRGLKIVPALLVSSCPFLRGVAMRRVSFRVRSRSHGVKIFWEKYKFATSHRDSWVIDVAFFQARTDQQLCPFTCIRVLPLPRECPRTKFSHKYLYFPTALKSAFLSIFHGSEKALVTNELYMMLSLQILNG